MKDTIQQTQEQLKATKQQYYAEVKRLYAELREQKKEVHCSKLIFATFSPKIKE